MPLLINPRHELFATKVAGGMPNREAAECAGYTPSRGVSLRTEPSVAARIVELADEADRARKVIEARAATLTLTGKVWVITKLKQVVDRAMQVEAVLNSKGEHTGIYRFDGQTAVRALELIGKEHGMFKDRVVHELGPDFDAMTDEELEQLVDEQRRALTLGEGARDITPPPALEGRSRTVN